MILESTVRLKMTMKQTLLGGSTMGLKPEAPERDASALVLQSCAMMSEPMQKAWKIVVLAPRCHVAAL